MTCTTTNRQAAITPQRNWLIEILSAVWRTFKHRHEAEQLLEMNEHHLADIGLSRGDVEAALSVSFLRDPSKELNNRRKRILPTHQD